MLGDADAVTDGELDEATLRAVLAKLDGEGPEWAGRTVAVLHEKYAAFRGRGEADALRKGQIAMGHDR